MLNTGIRNYVQKHKEDIFNELLKARNSRNNNEADFRARYSLILNGIFKQLNLSDKISQDNEYTVLNGRIDSLYGNFIIEYKGPGKIHRSVSPNNEPSIEQVKRYIHGLHEKNGIRENKIVGAVFDGYHIIYIKKRGGGWDVSPPQKMTADSHALFLMRLLSVNAEGKALTIEHLIDDFGTGGQLSISIISLFYKLLNENKELNKSRLLFEQWKILYQEVCGYDFDNRKIQIQELKKQYRIENEDIDLAVLIFSIQTYFALLIKLLSINILSYLKGGNFREKDTIRIEDSQSFMEDLFDIEQGGKFSQLGISNFLEGDFFSWYLFLWNDEIYIALQQFMETFNQYDYSMVVLEQEVARDILKNLYYELLPPQLRRNLGEFYTPDWLAEFLLEDLKPEISPDKTFLDPTCGSGTFIVLLIKKFINKYASVTDTTQLLDNIIHNVKGYDLNPLAVICARANYIIALGDLLSEIDSQVEIPIYLCDAMLTILQGYEEDVESYVIPTKAETFVIPKILVDNQNVNEALNLVNDCVQKGFDTEQFGWLLKQKLPHIFEKLSDKQFTVFINFYIKMKSLNDKSLDGIWTNVIKNAFAPIFQSQVDYVIGNPPWIDWQNLPENYRESIQKYWYDYQIFDHKGQKARLGSSHDDVSVLMTYVIMDNFLKDRGELAFVINQNLLQASGGGDGFRKFLIKGKTPVKVRSVHDFIHVEPFKDLGVNNKTATIILQKNEKNEYPLTYRKWDKCQKKTISSAAPLKDVYRSQIQCSELLAAPIDEYNSPWMITTPDKREIFNKMINFNKDNSYRARKGVDTSANGVYWVNVKRKVNNLLSYVDNTPSNSKKSVPLVTDCLVETSLLYPLLRGKDVKKWIYHSEYSILLPYYNDGRYISKEDLQLKYPHTWEYFYKEKHHYLEILQNRATYNKFIKRSDKNAPEYALYNIGSYTFSPYKVIWKALAKGVEAVTISKENNHLMIPDHNLLMIPLEDEDEAYYLSGVLNASIVSEFVTAYISWFLSAHILERIHIPRYDMKNRIHQRISYLSKKAHTAAAVGDGPRLKAAEKHLDKIVPELLMDRA